MKKKIKLIILLFIIGFLVWFLGINPKLQFSRGEELFLKSAKRYFELNGNELPTGERIKTLTLKELYHKSFIEKDIVIPYTKTTCSVDNSWVKVRRENKEYKYYVYLECGLLKSNIDHTGPVVKLKGNKEVQVNVGEEYKDEGVLSVKDSNDGILKVEDVVVKGEVNTNKVGSYTISYTAFDKLNNKTTVTRNVSVVQELYHTVKKELKDISNYQGNPKNNYVKLSNMLFRIYGYDKDNNIILVSDEDVSNVNFTKIDSWLEYYYNHLNDFTKKNIVETKYCNMSIDGEITLDLKECSSYTDKKKIYVPSVIDILKAEKYNEEKEEYEDCFMETYTISWTSSSKDKDNAYVVRNLFWGDDAGKILVSFPKIDNYGVRPMFTIKGNILITGGDGTYLNPYVFGDTPKAKNSSLVHDRYTGEYVSIKGDIFRIIETLDDGTTKVISNATVGNYKDNVSCTASANDKVITYNPKDKTSVAYYIANNSGEYIDTSFFTKHEIEVPIYKSEIIYKEEIEKKKYTVILSAPNMYDMFSAKPQKLDYSGSYWLVNSSKKERFTGAVSDIGVVHNNVKIPNTANLRIRVVGYLKKNIIISSGKGTLDRPYKLSK